MRLLVLDNYDSFTYNLVHLVRELGVQQVDVRRNDKISISEASTYDKIILSPGPGIPNEAGIMPELVRALAPTHHIFGVCLGHQCIAEVFGAKLENLESPVHGKATPILVKDKDDLLFKGLPSQFECGRYHSWVVSSENLPAELIVTAQDQAGQIMALRHKSLKIFGVQFHPESVLTQHGTQIVANWLNDSKI